MATYYALTTTNPSRYGWSVVGVGSTAAEANADGLDTLGPRTNDIYSDTEYKNYMVVSRSAAVRGGYISRKAVPVWDEAARAYRLEY